MQEPQLNDHNMLAQAQSIFAERLRRIRATTHQIMMAVLVVEAVIGLAAALWAVPFTRREVNPPSATDIAAALFMAGSAVITVLLMKKFPDKAWTRHLVAAVQILFSSLFVHLTAGHFETYFHLFASMALLAFYRDPRLLGTATFLIAIDLLTPRTFLPLGLSSGIFVSPSVNWIEHMGWVSLQNAVLLLGFRFSRQELMRGCRQQAEVAALNEQLQLEMSFQVRQQFELRRSEERFHFATQATNDSVWDWDIASNECWLAENLYSAFGIPKSDEPPLDTWKNSIHPDDLGRVMQDLNEFFAGTQQYWSGEYRFRRGDGSYAHVIDRGFVVRDAAGKPVRMIGAMQDITERKLLEAGQQSARLAAEEANLAKSEFLANMSHEIRTPLNGIIGMTELALETPLSREQTEYLVAIDHSALALLSVVNDVLDFAKVEANQLDFDSAEVDLRQVIEEVCKLTSVFAHRKELEMNVRIDPQIPFYVMGDGGRIRQVLLNLIGNAVKFTSKGEVNVLLDCVNVSGRSASIRFAVQDSGIGIPRQKLEAVFEKFVQADTSTRRNYGGTGLGLAISAALVEKMGGHIRLISEEGKGSTFSFEIEFPLPGNARLPRPALVAAPDFAGVSVLVVDDNATNRKILVDTLKGWDMKVDSAIDGLHALGMMREAKELGNGFHLLLTDSKMPKMDGFDLASVVKNDPAMAGTIILMLTSDNQSGDISRCRKLGIDLYMIKPVRQSELMHAIHGVLGRETAAAASSDVAAAPPETRRSLRVLLAEDNPINQMMAVRMLEKEGHLVKVAENGKVAVSLVNSERFDVVLMDVQMPDLDGFEATAAIRASAQERVAKIPIVAMTAHAMKTYAKKCYDAGMNGYVSKPIRRAELAKALMEHVHPEAAAVDVPEGQFHDFRERTGGDEALMLDLVDRFFDTAPRMLAELHIAVENCLWEEVAFQAHALKGAVGNFTGDGAFDSALQLELAARNGEGPDAVMAHERVVREIAALTVALIGEFKPATKASKAG